MIIKITQPYTIQETRNSIITQYLNPQQRMKHLTEELQHEVERATQVVGLDTYADILNILQILISNFENNRLKALSTYPEGIRWHPMMDNWLVTYIGELSREFHFPL